MCGQPATTNRLGLPSLTCGLDQCEALFKLPAGPDDWEWRLRQPYVEFKAQRQRERGR